MLQKLMMLLTLIVLIPVNAQEGNKSAIVLELFTSQGCSSCPPADELLENIKKKHKDQNVVVLSYHVDYWNRLGWKDPFSTSMFSDYQKSYAEQFNSRSIYTPQLVVNGSEHFTGSDHYKADIALKKYSKASANSTILIKDIRQEPSHIVFNYKVDGESFNTITLALVVSERITNIPRGENRDRTLKNTNIVANRMVQKEESGNISMTIPDWISENDELSIIAYTQDKTLKMTGATKLTLLK
ncbi:thioredoxin family protein [Aquimarina sp. MAR_2010_214]|uniref:DUF1223 domain-containing protein n=1 Tax=Aquimarina sp. MAR_2010_214 TaxID=1250026 RepID=UPI00130449C2|nr:DUF1223 domain-containing protein [Aquimarina sp. MAR_2010_214]